MGGMGGMDGMNFDDVDKGDDPWMDDKDEDIALEEGEEKIKEVPMEEDKEEDARKEKEGEDEGAPTISIIQIMAYLEKNKLQREGMLTMLELVDEKLDGRITEEQFVNCFRASHEMENDSVHGSGDAFSKAASLRKTGSERSERSSGARSSPPRSTPPRSPGAAP
mmetsp:Transcript_33428/g.78858  ORF Transcript_33428/g.78858 Transcript_33428/m.78858 type:complete len:165 (+) Transcript_33428:3-497(+)